MHSTLLPSILCNIVSYTSTLVSLVLPTPLQCLLFLQVEFIELLGLLMSNGKYSFLVIQEIIFLVSSIDCLYIL